MEQNYKHVMQPQRRLNLKVHEVIKDEIVKLLDAGLIYHVFDNPWVSPIHVVPKKVGMMVIVKYENELIPTKTWKESYENDNYGYDPYNDDMYEGQDIPDKLQPICDKFDITVRGRRKK
ncbi:hypothetical protein Tco_1052123 [Tanacetum coccineum]